MKAIKDNKEYTVDETSKGEYLAMGYDIYGDNGDLIERSPSSTISRKEYDELLARYNDLFEKYEALRNGKASEAPVSDKKKKAKSASGGEADVSGT